MTFAAVHPKRHEETLEISRAEFDTFVRDDFYFEEKTWEQFPLDKNGGKCESCT